MGLTSTRVRLHIQTPTKLKKSQRLTRQLGHLLRKHNPTVGRKHLMNSNYFALILILLSALPLQAATNLTLQVGWNLISTPTQPASTGIETVLGPIKGKFQAVYSYDVGQYKAYVPGGPDGGLSTIEAGRGYWISMTETATLTISGAAVNSGIDLQEGWNLVGYNSQKALTTEQALASIQNKYLVIYSYENATGSYKGYSPPDLIDLKQLEPGRGYWIYATEKSKWQLPVDENVATIYADCSFMGTAVSLPLGSYTRSQLAEKGLLDNVASSVKVPSGYQVVLYENDNFAGASLIVTSDINCLVESDFNDRTTSIKVQVYDPSTTPPTQPTYLRALGIDDSSIELTWEDKSSNESMFLIERSTSTTNFTAIATVPANTTSYISTGLNAGTKYYYRIRASNARGNSNYTNLTGAYTRETPPPTLKDYIWGGAHDSETMTLISYNDDVVFYGDQDFINTSKAQIETWIGHFITENWKYIKANYGSFGANRLYVFLHHNKFGGGTIASMFDSYSNGRNTIDVGSSNWSSSNYTLHQVFTHEMGHLIEGSSHNIHESPFFAIWGDSKWCEIHIYDLYYRTGLADAQRSYNEFARQSSLGGYWLRDWFHPLWKEHGETQFLYRMFDLLAKHFPKRLENNTNFIYSRRANRGEFYYFLSGAAGVSLKDRATKAFGWTSQTEAEWNKAKVDFPGVDFVGKD
jgi:hypothetical protein